MFSNGSCGQYRRCIKRNLFRFVVKHLSTLPANTTMTQCWTNADPASNQHWFNASCLLGCVQPSKHHIFAKINPGLGECIVFAGWSGIACSLLLATITIRPLPYVGPASSVLAIINTGLVCTVYFILPYLHAGGIVQSRCFESKLG